MLACKKLLLISLLMMTAKTTILLCSAAFTLTPAEVVVSPSSSDVAIFNCQHDTADVVGWLLNSTSLSHIGENFNTCIHLLPYGAPLHQLKIPTNLEYNMTMVVCFALFIDGSHPEMTNPVFLILRDNARQLPSGFVEEPYPSNMELVLVVGQTAVFKCQHCNTDNIRWRLNGTLILNGNVPDHVSITYTSQSPCGILFKLTISDIEQYNETTILCEADVEGLAIVTTSVKLLVQGALDSVSNLTRNFVFDAQSSYYTWRAPFSLDVANADPDIIYCVQICQVYCGSQQTMLCEATYVNCNVTDTNFTIHNTNELYKIEVLPRTNLDVAPNGTQVEYRGWRDKSLWQSNTDKIGKLKYVSKPVKQMAYSFIHVESEAVSYTISNAMNNDVQIKLLLNLQVVTNEVIPSIIGIKVMAIDEIATSERSDVSSCLITTLYDNKNATSFLHLEASNCSVLEMRRLYIGTLYVPVVDCRISDDIELSTHMITNITVSLTSQPNEILVSGDFVDTTEPAQSPGFMAIVYTESESNPEFHYRIAFRSEGEQHVQVNISGLLKDEYRVSVFALQEDGLPFIKSVATASSVTIKAGKNHTETDSNSVMQESTNNIVEYNIISRGPGCRQLSCIFMNTSGSSMATHCIAIISEKAQTTRRYGLLNIDVYNFTRHGDIATGCLPDINNTGFHIDVFTYHDNILSEIPLPLQEENNTKINATESNLPDETAQLQLILGTTLGSIIIIVVIAIIMIIIRFVALSKNSSTLRLYYKRRMSISPSIHNDVMEPSTRNDADTHNDDIIVVQEITSVYDET